VKILLLLVAAMLVGCAKDPVASAVSDNPEITLEIMFRHEGCTVYRFSDNARYHYWADCRGTVSSERLEGCGRNCARVQSRSIQTTERESP
jgi:hypothetical protein